MELTALLLSQLRGLLVFLIVVAYALAEQLPVMAQWIERPYLFVFPVIGAFATIVKTERAIACA